MTDLTGTGPTGIDVVVPTVGRPTLGRLLTSLAEAGTSPDHLWIVDDRPQRSEPLRTTVPVELAARTTVLRSGGRGPAAARNVGWRSSAAAWIAFLDDDVDPPPGWFDALVEDLRHLPPVVAGSQGNINVPLPLDRSPTDHERNVAGLRTAVWATADLAYRRRALEEVGGFDERFPRAYREDSDLGVRIVDAGYRIVRGRRWIDHPPGPADRWISVRQQRGNADDVLMRALHGRSWRARVGASRGRLPRHMVVTAAGVGALAALSLRHGAMALGAAAVWFAGTAEFAYARLRPGPRTDEELLTMIATSVAIPPAATFHALRGLATLPQRLAGRGPSPDPRPLAVLFDRDGTLVHDVPYNGDPSRVEPVDGAEAALARLRAAGIRLGVVTNQSGVARGLLDLDQVTAVNRRVDELLGPIDGWFVCPHGDDDGCACRKPAPGLIHRAAAAFDVPPGRCVVVGDTGADVEAALRAGARPLLVPNDVTRIEEIAGAPEVATSVVSAVDRLLGPVSGRSMPDAPDDRSRVVALRDPAVTV